MATVITLVQVSAQVLWLCNKYVVNSVVWMVPDVTWVGGLLCHLTHHSSRKSMLRPGSESVAPRRDYWGCRIVIWLRPWSL